MDGIHIDISKINQVDLRILCAQLCEDAKKFYEDPENRRRFEERQKQRVNDNS